MMNQFNGFTSYGMNQFGNNSSISVINGRVIVNGIEGFNPVDQVYKITIESVDRDPEIVYAKANEISIRVEGDCEDIKSKNAPVTIKGNCCTVKTQNGSIGITGDVVGGVTTHNGGISINGSVGGTVTSYNGAINHH